MNPSPAHQTLPLVTERLRVRLWTEADRAAFRRMNADPRVMKFFPSTLSEAEGTVVASESVFCVVSPQAAKRVTIANIHTNIPNFFIF